MRRASRAFDGAYYLAGYAVECGLKACIAKKTQRHEFPDKRRVDSSYSHNLRELIKVAGLSDAFSEHVRTDPDFGLNWEVVQAWSEQSRYEKHRSETAAQLPEAIGGSSLRRASSIRSSSEKRIA